jgi:GGDEF domain-containing protein
MLYLHVPTLLAAAAMVNLTLTGFCLSSWHGRRDREIYKWLSVTGSASSLGCILFLTRETPTPTVNIWLAQASIQLAAGMAWAGIRVFEGRKPSIVIMWAGVVVWTLAFLVPIVPESASARAALSSLIIATYYAAITLELLRGYRSEPLRSRLVSICVASVHVLFVLSRIGLIFSANLLNWPMEESSNVIGIFVLETIITMVTLVLSLTTMERDRAESEQRKAASTDVLTGAMSRRAFLDESRHWVEARGKDAALILFDIDHFKRINDTYGHAAGDRALITFTTLVTQRLESASMIAGFNLDESTSNQYPRWYKATMLDAAEGGAPLFGRLGGEEFACLLPHLSMPQSIAIAEDIRRLLGDLTMIVGADTIRMTVSASVVTTADIGHHLDEMFAAADEALYRAKHAGRNRVEIGKSVVNMAIRKFA